MKTKHIFLFAIGGVLLIGFAAFVLILALILAVGESVEREEAGKLTVAVRHKMIYESDFPPILQCVKTEVGVCETKPVWNPKTHSAGANHCPAQYHYPQPFFQTPEISDWENFEFDLKPDQTYYWYIFFEKDDRCISWLPPEIERFETGEIKLATKETKRIEKDFTK